MLYCLFHSSRYPSSIVTIVNWTLWWMFCFHCLIIHCYLQNVDCSNCSGGKVISKNCALLAYHTSWSNFPYGSWISLSIFTSNTRHVPWTQLCWSWYRISHISSHVAWKIESINCWRQWSIFHLVFWLGFLCVFFFDNFIAIKKGEYCGYQVNNTWG